MKDISPILQSLGLVESEIKTYLKALEGGPATAMELTKRTNLSRQAVYTAIETLSSRGLMSSALRGKKRFFAAEHPDKLLAYAKRRDAEMKERIADLERILPELALQMGGERPVVKVFEGKEGVRAIIEEMKKTETKEAFEITDLEAMYKVLSPDDLNSMRQELKKRNIYIKGFYSGLPGETVAKVNRVILPKEYSGFKAQIGIYGNKVYLVAFEGKMISMLVENAALSRTLAIIFDLAFKCAKKT